MHCIFISGTVFSSLYITAVLHCFPTIYGNKNRQQKNEYFTVLEKNTFTFYRWLPIYRDWYAYTCNGLLVRILIFHCESVSTSICERSVQNDTGSRIIVRHCIRYCRWGTTWHVWKKKKMHKLKKWHINLILIQIVKQANH